LRKTKSIVDFVHFSIVEKCLRWRQAVRKKSASDFWPFSASENGSLGGNRTRLPICGLRAASVVAICDQAR